MSKRVIREYIELYCACGCNVKLLNIDNRGRYRKFIHGHNKANSGNTHNAITKAKMSKAKKGKPTARKGKSIQWVIGEKNRHWKGGITPINEKIRKSIEYRLWRECIFKRDNYTCTCCKEKEKVSGRLEAHHIKPFAQFPELRFAIDNGQTLCKECHKKTDTYLNRWLKIA